MTVTNQPKTNTGEELVLEIFPGIGILGKGFEARGFAVMRGPDPIWGGDIRRFHVPAGRVNGVIGGPPCQDFSIARRNIPPTGYGLEMLGEYVRVIKEARPDWWILENVPGVPDVKIEGYNWQRLDLRASDFGLSNRRLRHIQFGSRHGNVLVIPRGGTVPTTGKAALASDDETPWDKFCQAQGLPPDFDIPAFTISAKRRAVGNAVPLPMAEALATAVANRVPEDSVRLCECRCGRPLLGRSDQVAALGSCRLRLLKRRRAALAVSSPGALLAAQ